MSTEKSAMNSLVHEIVQYLNVRDPQIADEVRTRILGGRDTSPGKQDESPHGQASPSGPVYRVLQWLLFIVGGPAFAFLTAMLTTQNPRQVEILLLTCLVLLSFGAVLNLGVLRTVRQWTVSSFLVWSAAAHAILAVLLSQMS
ncbi:hypothetical protein [Kineococcus sp. SYSU DK006]|uniref:hypothetical protein n=1 Tax=Kineococcus sp. SYSU DK006 TaxID=3383127 RepID=UPI003D7F145A